MLAPETLTILNNSLASCSVKNEFREKIAHFLSFLLQENKNLNLISRKLSIETIITDHIYDCLAGQTYFKKSKNILDIGSGGGFPALLLAAIFPEKNFTLVDKSVKKTNFLKKAAAELHLENVKVLCSPIDSAGLPEDIDSITCRAFKSIREILSFTPAFFNKNVQYILYKGKKDKITEELELAGTRFKFTVSIHRIKTDNEKERHMVLLQKEQK